MNLGQVKELKMRKLWNADKKIANKTLKTFFFLNLSFHMLSLVFIVRGFTFKFLPSKVKKQQELDTVQTYSEQIAIDVLSQQERSWKMSQRPTASPLCSLPQVSFHY